MAVSHRTVYAGGGFIAIGGHTHRYVVALRASNGAATAWRPRANGDVGALAVWGSTVYVGGYFTAIGGQTRKNIAALRASSGSAMAWNPRANWRVSALAVSGSTVYIGGYFTAVAGKSRHHVAALRTGSGTATAWNPNANADVNALAVSGSTVYAGGGFGSIGDETRPALARFSPITGPWIGAVRPVSGRVGATVTIAGWNFGASRGTAKVFFGGKAATSYVLWRATKIEVKVPRLATGRVSVTVGMTGATSNAKTFKVL